MTPFNPGYEDETTCTCEMVAVDVSENHCIHSIRSSPAVEETEIQLHSRLIKRTGKKSHAELHRCGYCLDTRGQRIDKTGLSII